MPTMTPEPIMKIAMGFMAAKHLFVASEIGLFAALADGAASLDVLARNTGVPPRTLEIVIAAIVGLGLIEQDGGSYRNSEVAAAFLAGKPGPDLRPNLRFWDQISYPAWQKLADAVRSGQGQVQFGKFDERQQQIFSAGVESFTAPTAAALAAAYDFNNHRRVLDVGGGTGSFLIPILKRYASLKATLFELPGTCDVARQRLSKVPEGARIDIMAGSVFQDPLPSGHDALIVANTVHVFSAEHNIELMKKMRAAVSAGARLLLVDLWTDPSGTEPLPAALISAEFLVISGEGQTYRERDADDWLAQTGWKKLERKPLAGPSSLIVAAAV